MKLVGMALLCLLVLPAVAATPKQENPGSKRPAGGLQAGSAPAGNAQAGKAKLEESGCQECHGLDGLGQGPAVGGAGKFAKLAGQYPDYTVKQIRDFRSGARKNDLMSIMAKSLDDLDAADIAAWYASQKKAPASLNLTNKTSDETGKNLFSQGDATRNILPCSGCHGPEGKGLEAAGQTIPQLAGQDEQYLQRQLQDWRSGDRHNSAGGVMNTIAKSLSDTEIEALTHYISAL